MITAILLLVLGVGFLAYNHLVAAPGSGFMLIGTSIDFGWALIALGVFNLVRYWKYRPRRRKRRPEEP